MSDKNVPAPEAETPEEKGMHDDLLKRIQEIDQKLAMFQQASGEIKPEDNVYLIFLISTIL
mgnify:CR=1 FL=1